MSAIARYLLPLVFGVVLVGCREFEMPLVAHSSTAQHRSDQLGPFCGIINSPLVPITVTVPYADATVMAGFRSDFFPGAQPFPCDRLTSYRSQGAMMFTTELPAGVGVNTVTALLEISAFSPTVPIRVTEARPLATATSGGYSGATRSACRFSVKSYPRSSYVPGPSNYGGSWLVTTELIDTGTDRFWVPIRSLRAINVTEEFRRSIVAGETVMRLAIEPDDQAMFSAASNNCFGQFTVRLRLLAPDE